MEFFNGSYFMRIITVGLTFYMLGVKIVYFKQLDPNIVLLINSFCSLVKSSWVFPFQGKFLFLEAKQLYINFSSELPNSNHNHNEYRNILCIWEWIFRYEQYPGRNIGSCLQSWLSQVSRWQLLNNYCHKQVLRFKI